MITELFVLKVDKEIFCEHEGLAQEKQFLLIGIVPGKIEKSKKYDFAK